MAKAFLFRDTNKDFALNVDGFIAVLLLPEYGMRKVEATEVFSIISRGG